MSSNSGGTPDPPNPEENEVGAVENSAPRSEPEAALAAPKSPWWRREAVALAILAAAAPLVVGVVAEKLREFGELELQERKARYDLILNAMKTQDIAVANRNINFFIDSGLLEDSDCKIRGAIERYQPVLPLSGAVPPPGMHNIPEIMRLYKFPEGYDGRGQTIGFIELGGGSLIRRDLAQYFEMIGISTPPPDVFTVYVDGAKFERGTDGDGEVMINTEIAGSIAPKARIRIYFAPNNPTGYADAVKRATADRVSVLGIGWGSAESKWKDEDIKAIDTALEAAAKQGMTILVATGDQGVTDGEKDGRRHVDFPASSPWALSVGGTTVTSQDGQITSETVFKDNSRRGIATGGGVSAKFTRPDWQATVSFPSTEDKVGRGIPDVVASADQMTGVYIILHGEKQPLYGTSGAMSIWAGLIALINQGLGYNVGYLTPRLYREIGPEGLFNAITSGDNSVGGVKGYTAGPGWTPVAGWGSPDGKRLLDWLRTHPDTRRSLAAGADCRPNPS
jgi:subtilase family serine protease